jgi:hypothetical protein
MTAFETIIFHNLSMNKKEMMIFDKYQIEEYDMEDDFCNKVYGKGNSWGTNPPALLKHDHIDVSQRNFSILLRPGNNYYAVFLDPKIQCQFGNGEFPVGIFSARFYRGLGLIQDVKLWKKGVDKPLTESEVLKISDLTTLRGYDLLTFRVHYEETFTALTAIKHEALHKKAEAHDEVLGDGDGHHDEDEHRFAIPFYFNLYDVDSGVPIWVLNNHEHDDRALKARWHGKVHPNSNAFLIIE